MFSLGKLKMGLDSIAGKKPGMQSEGNGLFQNLSAKLRGQQPSGTMGDNVMSGSQNLFGAGNAYKPNFQPNFSAPSMFGSGNSFLAPQSFGSSNPSTFGNPQPLGNYQGIMAMPNNTGPMFAKSPGVATPNSGMDLSGATSSIDNSRLQTLLGGNRGFFGSYFG